MRLTTQEIQAFVSALSPYIEQIEAELRLYGSRTDDHKKGGDIDLLLIVADQQFRDQLIDKKHKILGHIVYLLFRFFKNKHQHGNTFFLEYLPLASVLKTCGSTEKIG